MSAVQTSAPSAPLSGFVQFGPGVVCTTPVSVGKRRNRFCGSLIVGSAITIVGKIKTAANAAAPAMAKIPASPAPVARLVRFIVPSPEPLPKQSGTASVPPCSLLVAPRKHISRLVENFGVDLRPGNVVVNVL